MSRATCASALHISATDCGSRRNAEDAASSPRVKNRMTAFDYVMLAIVVLSAALGIWRGVIREVFALGAWILAIICMFLFGQIVANALPLAGQAAWLKSLVGYALVFVGVFIVTSIIGYLFSKLINAVGLSFIDRALGAMFGVVRGVLIAVLLVLVGGATNLPQSDWWKDSATAKPLETFAAVMRNKFPNDLAKKFKNTVTPAHAAVMRQKRNELCVA
jgi:membrane protein required for colicin V production